VRLLPMKAAFVLLLLPAASGLAARRQPALRDGSGQTAITREQPAIARRALLQTLPLLAPLAAEAKAPDSEMSRALKEYERAQEKAAKLEAAVAAESERKAAAAAKAAATQAAKAAREEAAIAAREENYYEYNITKGVASHKIYTGTAPPLASAAATKHSGAPPQLAGNKKGGAPQLKGAAALPKDVVLKIKAAKGTATLAGKARPQDRQLIRRGPVALPARVRAEEQIMERAMAKEVAAQKRQAFFRAEMHAAQMKLAHQEMGLPAHRGPVAERDAATVQSLASMGLGLVPVTQKLGEMGTGPESDHMVAVKKAEIVNEPLDSSLIDSNEEPSSDTIDEVNTAIASQRADGYTNGEGAAVEDVTLPESD